VTRSVTTPLVTNPFVADPCVADPPVAGLLVGDPPDVNALAASISASGLAGFARSFKATAPEESAENPEAARPPETFLRRHRVAMYVATATLVVVCAGVGVFGYMWTHTGPHELSTSAAYQRFVSGSGSKIVDPGTLRPHEGVYSYSGTANEQISLPPKSQTEGPGMPVTVTYNSAGCWTWRMDYSDSHWQSSTYCPRDGNLVLTARGGWYRWNFVMLTIADTATYSCNPAEMTLPKLLHQGERFNFSCKGSNHPINTGVVEMSGYNEYVGTQTMKVAGHEVPVVHFREVSTFSGGQTGTNVADTWFSTSNGLPLKGTWATAVHSPTIVGTSTLTAKGGFELSSFTPRS